MALTGNSAAEKAKILAEALPYIRRFHGKTVVIKYGGNAMTDERLKNSFAHDIVLLKLVGINPVVVHGGGPQIDDLLKQLGRKGEFVQGMRVTDAATMDVVEMVLGGSVNQEIVGLICQHGGRAVGLSGKDDHFVRAAALDASLGRVGDVETVDPSILLQLIGAGFIPVVAPIAVDEAGQALNVNADVAAGRIAAALSAAKLVLMTDVEGVLDPSGQLLRSIGSREADELVEKGVVRGGMIPKLACALEAVRDGVEKVHVIDGRRRHALLLEIFTDQGVGTEIRPAD
jgi:acetylglutamate kinase